MLWTDSIAFLQRPRCLLYIDKWVEDDAQSEFASIGRTSTTDIPLKIGSLQTPMSESKQIETVELPAEIVAQIEERAERTEFDDVSAYLLHVLQQILHEVDQSNEFSDADPVDEQQVEERLKSLGYLNE